MKTRCSTLLTELELIKPDESIDVQSLTGGVASDIALVKVGTRKLCVKFALPKLKVEADWFAPVHRNAAEYAWLKVLAGVAPESAVQLFGQSQALNGFAMEYIEGDDTYLWKQALLNEHPDRGEAAKVGDLIGRVHAASTQPRFDTRNFQNRDDFQALRIEPYLLYTASVHADIADALKRIANQLYNNQSVLSHGDVSPKNIVVRQSGPVVLDAECATMGDACFDPAFCLNHLVLKAIHLPGSRQRYLENAIQLWQAYNALINWEEPAELESRVCRLLPALMLARVDGKSPVEYFSASEQQTVRSVARTLVMRPVDTMSDFIEQMFKLLEEQRA